MSVRDKVEDKIKETETMTSSLSTWLVWQVDDLAVLSINQFTRDLDSKKWQCNILHQEEFLDEDISSKAREKHDDNDKVTLVKQCLPT